MKRILLIITGSIACYKSLDLIRQLRKNNFEVNCILTKSAREFITPLLVSSLTGNKTYEELFALDDEIKMGHIKLARQHDLIVIAPASCDFIAKIANGLGDDLASCVILASDKKIILAPAMNEKMWNQSGNQKNLQKLLDQDVEIIDPENDILACGEYGIGKMANIEKIYYEINNFFINQNLLAGKKIVISGGSTREMIDPVRFIGNNSTGKQAIAIVKILKQMNAQIHFIAGNITLPLPLNNQEITRVENTDEMFEAIKNKLDNADIFISCAAVADFKVKNISHQKIKKNTLRNFNLELESNIDILESIGNSINRPKIVIGFCAESENLLENARQKLRKKNCDLIIANDIENGKIFGSDETKAYFIDHHKQQDLGKITKNQLALLLAKEIVNLIKN
jgi:phosphopantothenoylcysteine decarboxylase/phosphopantothenate--cysteine ligase